MKKYYSVHKRSNVTVFHEQRSKTVSIEKCFWIQDDMCLMVASIV